MRIINSAPNGHTNCKINAKCFATIVGGSVSSRRFRVSHSTLNNLTGSAWNFDERMNRPRSSRWTLYPRSFEIPWESFRDSLRPRNAVRGSAAHRRNRKSPSADDDPIFWQGGRFLYASPASVQCPMKGGKQGEGKREVEKAARFRTAVVWVKLFSAPRRGAL